MAITPGEQPEERKPKMDRQTHRTIHVTYRNHSRLARIRLRRPHPSSPRPLLSARITALFPALRVPDEPTHYTPELALELLAGTSELPENKHALFIILSEYAYALHTLATQALSQQPDATR